MMKSSHKSSRLKYGMLFLCALSVIAMLFRHYNTRIVSFPSEIFFQREWTPELSMRYKSQDYGVVDPRDPQFYNIILEEEALMFEPCRDINKTASAQHSKIALTDHFNGTYNIGELIRAIVTLHDGYGKRKYSGGDHLRATIENKELKASAPCMVTDNKDGTQTIACEALWSGTSTIHVALVYARETITTLYRIRTEELATENIKGMFKSRTYSEATTCHPNHTHLLKHRSNNQLCNMTYINSGMPFYCVKPKNVHLLCQDWQLVRTETPYPELNLTECEEKLLKSGQHFFKKTIVINVQKRKGDERESIIDKPSIPCLMYNISLLWQSRSPTGFIYEGKWNLRHCLGFKQNQYQRCLKHRRLYLYGDSTARQWYKTIMERFKCQQITEKWENKYWHKETECYNADINFKAGWYPHAQPFFGGGWEDVRYTLYSVTRRLNDIPRGERAIVVIQIYLHILSFHHSVFEQRMKIIRQSVEKFLENNKESIVMIKAPHTFANSPVVGVRFSDYFGYVYSKILYEIFEGLHDRVVLLNHRDITIAEHENMMHPGEDIVNAMVDQMLSFVCNE